MKRYVVCSACKSQCGELMLIGARHYDSLMHKTMKALEGAGYKWTAGEQGFVDQYGEFMTREEAWIVARASGQIRRRVGGDTLNGGRLFSENLY